MLGDGLLGRRRGGGDAERRRIQRDLLPQRQPEDLLADAEDVVVLDGDGITDPEIGAVEAFEILDEDFALPHRNSQMATRENFILRLQRDIGGLPAYEQGLF